MAQWDSYEQKQTPDDNDTLLIKDSNAGTNKRTPLSGVWNYIKNKLNQDGQDYFVKKDQGQENSGKILGIGEDGMVLPVDQESGTGGTVSVRVESTTTGEPGTVDERYWKEISKTIAEKVINKEITAEEAKASTLE